MRTDIYLVLTFEIKAGHFEELAALAETLAKNSRQEEGCLAYEFSATADRAKAHMVEHFRSSAALIDHITHGFSRYAEAWNGHLTLANMVVIGDPSDELRRLLPTEAVYADPIAGFTK